MSSLYRVYRTSMFRNAPLSKLWCGCTLLVSLALIPFARFRRYFSLSLSNVADGTQLWRIVTSRLAFTDIRVIISGVLLIYYMRVMERRYGSKRFFNFLLTTTMLSTAVELATVYGLSLRDFHIHFLSTGPLSVLFALLIQFILDVPWMVHGHIGRIPMSSKFIPMLLGVQMFLSSPSAMVACLSGGLVSLLYRLNFLHVQQISFVPDSVCDLAKDLTAPVTELFEDTTGRVLPVGATVELQRQDVYDRMEQRLIYEAIQRQQQQNHHRGNPPQGGLAGARRWFLNNIQGDVPDRMTVAVEPPPEAKISALTEMGWRRATVIEALRSSNNDVNGAASLLLHGGVR